MSSCPFPSFRFVIRNSSISICFSIQNFLSIHLSSSPSTTHYLPFSLTYLFSLSLSPSVGAALLCSVPGKASLTTAAEQRSTKGRQRGSKSRRASWLAELLVECVRVFVCVRRGRTRNSLFYLSRHPRAPLITSPHQDRSLNPSAARSEAPSPARPPADSLFHTAKMSFFGSLQKERALVDRSVALPRLFITTTFVGRSENGDHNHPH